MKGRRPSGRIALTLLWLVTLIAIRSAEAAAQSVSIEPSHAQVWVAGRQIAFDRLAVAYADPVAPVGDPGLESFLRAVGARAQWQPGTRFVAITRADGRLVTFTLGSNAVSVDGRPRALPFAPFDRASDFYLPLRQLGEALGLRVRGFGGGYVFVPQIVAVNASVQPSRTVLRVGASAPLDWRSSYDARKKALTLRFAGFGSSVAPVIQVPRREVVRVAVDASGPPGYPTAALRIWLKPGVKFAARHGSDPVSAEIVMSRQTGALRDRQSAQASQNVSRTVPVATAPPTPLLATPKPTAAASPSPSPQLESPPPQSPAAEPTEAEPTPTESSASAAPSESKITDVGVLETTTGTRLVVSLSGPVSYSWHRLADPDNRYWLDIDGAVLIGPAQQLNSKLPFIKTIRVSQHQIVPRQIVRVSIAPSQPIDVRVSPVEGAFGELAIDILSAPPEPGLPSNGGGSLGELPAVKPSAGPAKVSTRPDLIVIDPGHGGNDPGAIPLPNGLIESHINLDVSKRVQQGLRKLGWHVVLTRDGDYEVGDPKGPDRQELQARCDIANAGGARLFISIHANASGSSSTPHGATTYFWRADSRGLAHTLQHDFVAATGLSDDGVQRARFWVIKHTDMPSVLIETAFLSSPRDAALLAQAAFIDKVAAGIVRGIMDYTGGPQTPVGENRTPHLPNN